MRVSGCCGPENFFFEADNVPQVQLGLGVFALAIE